MYDFVAIDFETANNNFNSACSLGIVAVKDFEIIKREYYLIRPPINSDIFNSRNIEIHGITYDQVINQPFFNEIWNQVKEYLNNEIVIAHNVNFDMSVLKNCLDTYNIYYPEFIYIDSITISSVVCGAGFSKKLEDRANLFEIKIEDHHNSLCDAEAAAKLVIKTINIKQAKSFTAFYNKHLNKKIKLFSEFKAGTMFGSKNTPKRFQKINIDELAANTDNISKSNPFFNKSCVFTGELNALDRKSAMQKVVNMGGIIKNGISKTIDYLIVGRQEIDLVGEDGMSTKEEKAYAYIKQGVPIKILNETEFLELLNS